MNNNNENYNNIYDTNVVTFLAIICITFLTDTSESG